MRSEGLCIISNFFLNGHFWCYPFVFHGFLSKAEFQFNNILADNLLLDDILDLLVQAGRNTHCTLYSSTFHTSHGILNRWEYFPMPMVNLGAYKLLKKMDKYYIDNKFWQVKKPCWYGFNLRSKRIRSYRFEAGTGCQSSTARVNAHHTKWEYSLSPFRLSHFKKIPHIAAW